MKSIKSTNLHLLVLEKGEEIVKSLIEHCQSNNINSAWISGLGALSQASLALYQLDSKSYSKTKIEGDFELLMLNGNIGQLENKTMAHLHAVISDKEMHSLGGHLDSAVVAATCEIKLELLPFDIQRKFSEEIGLNLIQGDPNGAK